MTNPGGRLTLRIVQCITALVMVGLLIVPVSRAEAAFAFRVPSPYRISEQAGPDAVAWRLSIGDPAALSPAVRWGTVVATVDENGMLYVLDAEHGKHLLSRDLGLRVLAAPLISGNVLVIAGEGKVIAFDLKTLRQKWTFSIDGDPSIFATPAASSDFVFIGTEANNVHALDLSTGEEAWRFDAGAWVIRNLLLVKDHLFFVNDDNTLFSVAVADGSLAWSASIGEGPHGSTGGAIASDGSSIFALAASQTILAFGVGSGALQWSLVLSNDTNENWLVAADGLIYIKHKGLVASVSTLVKGGDSFFFLYGIDPSAETMSWSTQYPGLMSSGLAASGAALNFGSTDGTVYATDAGSGKLLWKFFVNSSVTGVTTDKTGTWIATGDQGLLSLISSGGSACPTSDTPAVNLNLAEAPYAVVVSDGVKIKAAPSDKAANIQPAPKCTVVKLTGKSEKRGGATWWAVETSQTGRVGWIRENDLSPSLGKK